MVINSLFQKWSIFFQMIMILLFCLNIVNCEGLNLTLYNKSNSEKCSSNLECYSACCSSGECVETSKCENLVTIVYICEAALCLVFIIAFTIYLVIKLKKIKDDFKKKTKDENKDEKQN